MIVREFDPTPRTNPILWWLAVLIHCDLHRCHPRLSILGLEDSLDFAAKLDALDHYSRVPVFHNTFIDWTTLRDSFQPLPSNQLQVARWVDAENIAWVDRDREAPHSDSVEDVDLDSLAWSEYHHHLCTAVNAWLVAEAEEPMRVIIALHRGVRADHQLTEFYECATLGDVFDDLAFIHLRGYMHRDIEPDNIGVDLYPVRAAVLDFGRMYASQ